MNPRDDSKTGGASLAPRRSEAAAGQRSSRGRGAKFLLPGAALLVPIGVTAWLLARKEDPAPAPAPEAPEISAPAVASAAPPAAVEPPREPLAAEERDAGAAEPIAEEIVINPADPDAPRPDAALRPHPLTPMHERIFRENNLIGALYGAMDIEDARGVRRLADQYRREFPDDPNQLQAGYDIIADCLEHPGPATAEAGQRYFDSERGSTLRRFVARLCLDR